MNAKTISKLISTVSSTAGTLVLAAGLIEQNEFYLLSAIGLFLSAISENVWLIRVGD